MKSELLHDLWSSPDNNRLISKQFSFRLPVHIAAKITALGEMYPQKNRTQIVADLLSSALDDLEKNLPYTLYEAPQHVQRDQADIARHLEIDVETQFEMGGARARFRELSNKFYSEFEKELGNAEAAKLFEQILGPKAYLKETLG